MFRHWRIQVSLICFTLLLAVIVFWVRSYSWVDVFGWVSNANTSSNVMSYHGEVSFNKLNLPSHSISTMPHQLVYMSMKDSAEIEAALEKDRKGEIGFLGIHARSNSYSHHFGVSYWFPTIFTAALTGLPWYWGRFNFSLRTFLITFTAFALLLGLLVWLMRSAAAS